MFDDDLKLLKQFLGPGPISTFDAKGDLPALQNQIYFGPLEVVGGVDKVLVKGLSMDMPLGLEEREHKKKEVEEFVGFLGLVVEGMRYLAPRMPIPHSEHLFRHHVC